MLGPAVDDGRHLVAALDQATTAATIGVNLIAKATAPGSHLIDGTRVNIAEVKHLAKRIHRDRTASRGRAGRDRRGPTAMSRCIGGKIDSLKDQAAAQLTTTEVSYRQLKPLLEHLPASSAPRVRGPTC